MDNLRPANGNHSQTVICLLGVSMLFTLFLISALVSKIALEPNTLTHALVRLIEESFARKVDVFNFYIQCEEQTRCMSYFWDLADSTLRELDNIAIRVGVQQELPVDGERHYCLFAVDSVNGFHTLLRRVRAKYFNIEGYVLIVLKTFDGPYYDELMRLFEATWRASILNVNIVVEPLPGSVLMFTYFPFSAYSCNQVFPVLSNRFTKSKWESDNLFPLKLDNMHGCPLICATWEDDPYFRIARYEETGAEEYNGIEGKLLEFIANNMNFSVQFYFMNDEQIDATLEEGGLVFDQLFLNGTAFVIGAFQYKPTNEDDFFMPTSGYYVSTVIIVLSSRRNKLTPFQKLIFPFDPYVWLLIFAYFGIGILVTQRSRILPQHQRNFILGSMNHIPVYNMFLTALGSGVHQVPTRNFARFLLFIWMILWLVLRSGYQSALFHFIKSDMSLPLPDSIEDVISDQYQIFLTPPMNDALKNIPSIQGVSQILNGSEVENFPMLQRDERKLAIITSYEYFGLFKKRNRGQIGGFYISKENVISYQLSIYLKKSSFLVSDFNQKIFEYASIGLMGKWEAVFIDVDWNKGRRESEAPKNMTIQEILGAIGVYFLGIVISTGTFGIEIIVHNFSNWWRKVVDKFETC